jgi:hypothetical protein
MCWKRRILGLPLVASGVLAGEACRRLTLLVVIAGKGAF